MKKNLITTIGIAAALALTAIGARAASTVIDITQLYSGDNGYEDSSSATDTFDGTGYLGLYTTTPNE